MAHTISFSTHLDLFNECSSGTHIPRGLPPLKRPTRTSRRSIKCRNLWMLIQSTSVPLVTAELLQSNKRADCLTLKKPTRATNYKKILVRSSIFVRDSLLLLKLNCDQLDRIGGLRSNRGNKQEPDTKLTWMNNWNDVGVEDRSEDETRFCYFHQHA